MNYVCCMASIVFDNYREHDVENLNLIQHERATDSHRGAGFNSYITSLWFSIAVFSCSRYS